MKVDNIINTLNPDKVQCDECKKWLNFKHHKVCRLIRSKVILCRSCCAAQIPSQPFTFINDKSKCLLKNKAI